MDRDRAVARHDADRATFNVVPTGGDFPLALGAIGKTLLAHATPNVRASSLRRSCRECGDSEGHDHRILPRFDLSSRQQRRLAGLTIDAAVRVESGWARDFAGVGGSSPRPHSS